MQWEMPVDWVNTSPAKEVILEIYDDIQFLRPQSHANLEYMIQDWNFKDRMKRQCFTLYGFPKICFLLFYTFPCNLNISKLRLVEFTASGILCEALRWLYNESNV